MRFPEILSVYITWTRILGWNQKPSLFCVSHCSFSFLIGKKLIFQPCIERQLNLMSSWKPREKIIFKVTVIRKFSFKSIDIVSSQVFQVWVRAEFLPPTFSFPPALCSGFLTPLDLKRGKRERQGGHVSEWFGQMLYWMSTEHFCGFYALFFGLSQCLGSFSFSVWVIHTASQSWKALQSAGCRCGQCRHMVAGIYTHLNCQWRGVYLLPRHSLLIWCVQLHWLSKVCQLPVQCVPSATEHTLSSSSGACEAMSPGLGRGVKSPHLLSP